MKDFIIQFKSILNLHELNRQAGIKGQLLQQVARKIKYRNLQPEQEEKLKEIFLPVYQALKKIFEEK